MGKTAKSKTKSRIRVRLVRSRNGAKRNQRETLRSLGLRRLGSVAEHADSESVRGMVHAVRHLVEVESAR